MRPDCTCCTSPDRKAIDDALLAGTNVRGIALQFGLSKSATARHRRHIGRSIVRAHERKAERKGERYDESILEKAQLIEARSIGHMELAEAAGDLRLAHVANHGLLDVIRFLKELTTKPEPDEAALKRVSRWWAEELETSEEELAEQNVKVTRINADLLAGRHVPHTSKELPGGREHYLQEAQKEAERLAKAYAQPPPPVAAAPPLAAADVASLGAVGIKDAVPGNAPEAEPDDPLPWKMII